MPLEVHVWSDVACPWCYVGKKRLVAAAQSSGAQLDLIWHSFELEPRPLAPEESVDYVGRLARKYGRSRAQAQAMIDNMQNIGRAEGISFDFARATFANTFDAHRLLKWAHADFPLKQNLLATGLFEAHLCGGEDLNDRATLVSIAAAAGLPPDTASEVVHSDAYSQEVRADERLAQEMGVSGVPFYVIGQYGIGGAQQPETFQKVIAKVLAESATGPDASFKEGDSCGPEGC